MKLLSIIIPAYNAEPYIEHLMNRLKPQITDEVEVLVIDDGSSMPYIAPYDWVTVHRLEKNMGVSVARNTGIELSRGEYIAFVDADDLVSADYISKIMEKIKTEQFDYCYLSWKTIGHDWSYEVKLKSIDDKFPPFNLCVWNRVYKRTMIGTHRFNVRKRVAEDAEFIHDLKEAGKKKAFIPEIIYEYRSDTPNSITKRFRKGQIKDARRVVYHYPEVTKDMTWLIKEAKELNKTAEVMIMTNHNELPELEEFCMILKPQPMRATELRGEPLASIEIIKQPIRTQVVLYTHWTDIIGGIETFIYSWIMRMKQHYDIIVLYDQMNENQIERLEPHVQVLKNDPDLAIECDTLIMNRVLDPIPKNITYRQSVQMINGMVVKGYPMPKDRDKIVCVSNAVKESWGKDAEDSMVIHNLTYVEEPKQEPLLLVSATRIDTPDKGENRMITLAKLLEKNGISFIWLAFTNRPLPANAPKSMIRMEPTLDILKYIKKADYLVQLSDAEGFCYSIVESLSVGTPVIVTPISVLPEIGVKDGENGYVLPFVINDKVDVKKLLSIPKFTYKFNNNPNVTKWKKLIGNMKPTHSYRPPEKMRIRIVKEYKSTALNRNIKRGELLTVNKDRANVIINAGYAVKEE